jgi:murein endopeptidase
VGVAIAVAMLAGVGGFALLGPDSPTQERTVAEESQARRVEPRQRTRPSRARHRERRVEPIRWRRSRAVGLPHAGRLVRGVQLPAEGTDFFTWDPILRRQPNRGWRRHGTDRLLRTLLRVVRDHRAAHPHAPRVGIGDLSRPQGGDFGPQYGIVGHYTHQNGLDADVYYPRRDRRARPPLTVAQIDRRLSQDLVDRFVRAGARRVLVGPSVGVGGNPRRVQAVAGHGNHLHVSVP